MRGHPTPEPGEDARNLHGLLHLCGVGSVL